MTRLRVLFLTTPIIALLFLSLPLSLEGLVCFSNSCTDINGLCNDYCTGPSDICHLITNKDAQTGMFTTVDLGCSHSTHNCSNECVSQQTIFGNVHYCCCHTDFCNHVPGETDHTNPNLGIATDQPPGGPPVLTNNTVCEAYNCSPGNMGQCYHGYEVCPEPQGDPMPYCNAVYEINTDHRLELLRKGCEYEDLPSYDCYNKRECHVDNPLEGEVNDIHMCCCGESLCNLNETFTHPTQHVSYGMHECDALGCHHSCLIVSNIPKCVCDDGFALNGSTGCVDIDECQLDLDDCDPSKDEVCVNTDGSYLCVCRTGYYYDKKLQSCIDDDGIVCAHYKCENSTHCEASVEHCALTTFEDFEDPRFHFCQATYILKDGQFISKFSSCLYGAHAGCGNDKCVLEPAEGQHYFCCCYGDFCNTGDLLDIPPIPSMTTNTHSLMTSSKGFLSMTDITGTPSNVVTGSDSTGLSDILMSAEVIVFSVVVLACTVIIIIVIAVICIVRYHIKHHQYLPPPSDLEDILREVDPPMMQIIPKLDMVIGQGRFAKVYCTKHMDQQVAIKIFYNTHPARESWTKEKEIYSTPLLEHNNILEFLGAERRMYEGLDTFWLIFEYQPNGSLYDYLQHKTVTLKEFATLAQSAACGLAHLHSEISQDHVMKKPAIAHRDLKSKNILVKSNMTSVISDFGLAIKLNQGEHPSDAQGQVGTSRYMAPEVLEGAISFHQESFLRIDVYAFGLVLWEIASRCEMPGHQVGEYRPPFEDIVSPNPSIPEMRAIVAEKQKRPEIQSGFLINQDYETVVDAITESWDPDAEARPSAHLIETRLSNFCDKIDPPSYPLNHSNKESGYLSHQPLPSPINITSDSNPLPLTPSSSPSATMSPPSSSKPTNFNMQFGLHSRSFFSSSSYSVSDSGSAKGNSENRVLVHNVSRSAAQLQKQDVSPTSSTSASNNNDRITSLSNGARPGPVETSV